MTALDKYVRLESDAIWRAGPQAQRRDVTISFGDATLVIADGAGRPLAHWSLPALIRQNAGEMPAIYTPDEDDSEEIEIADETMVAAIEEVRAALAKARPRPGKLRLWLSLTSAALVLALAIFWLPGALTRQTLAVVPAAKQAEIGQLIAAQMIRQTGAPCRSPRTEAAASRLAQRVFGAQSDARVLIVPRLSATAVLLPGRLFLLDAPALQVADDPAVAAAYLLAAEAAQQHETPLAGILDRAGLGSTFRLLTTGDLTPETIAEEAARAITPKPVASDALRKLLADAQVPQAPYLAAEDARAGSMPDLGADPLQGRALPLILTDSDWVSLQNACLG